MNRDYDLTDAAELVKCLENRISELERVLRLSKLYFEVVEKITGVVYGNISEINHALGEK